MHNFDVPEEFLDEPYIDDDYEEEEEEEHHKEGDAEEETKHYIG